MTSQMTPVQKPALPPKPVKYRAPAPPTTSTTTSVICALPAVVKKYRAPAPPGGRPPPPPPPSQSTSSSSSSAASRVMMRREPMQVLPSSMACYERCLTQSGVTAATTTSTNDGVVAVNSPGKVAEEMSRHQEPMNRSTSEASTKAPSDRVLTADNSSTADRPTEAADDRYTAAAVVKPVVDDVKLCPRNSAELLQETRQRRHTTRSWRSTESIDRLITSGAMSADGGGGPSARSSFVVEPATSGGATSTTATGRRCCVYIDLGEYQTLLKHGRQDVVYSLPQPHCYGDETLRAVKLITEKYDTLKRRQMRALSFREAAAVAGAVKTSPHSDTIAEGLFYVKRTSSLSARRRENNLLRFYFQLFSTSVLTLFYFVIVFIYFIYYTPPLIGRGIKR